MGNFIKNSVLLPIEKIENSLISLQALSGSELYRIGEQQYTENYYSMGIEGQPNYLIWYGTKAHTEKRRKITTFRNTIETMCTIKPIENHYFINVEETEGGYYNEELMNLFVNFILTNNKEDMKRKNIDQEAIRQSFNGQWRVTYSDIDRYLFQSIYDKVMQYIGPKDPKDPNYRHIVGFIIGKGMVDNHESGLASLDMDNITTDKEYIIAAQYIKTILDCGPYNTFEVSGLVAPTPVTSVNTDITDPPINPIPPITVKNSQSGTLSGKKRGRSGGKQTKRKKRGKIVQSKRISHFF